MNGELLLWKQRFPSRLDTTAKRGDGDPEVEANKISIITIRE